MLVPELFYDHMRVAHLRRTIQAGVRVHLVVPDFLTYLRPDAFDISSTRNLMPYLDLLFATSHRAFISGAVRSTFAERILHGPFGPDDLALDLGADGLAVERQTFDPRRTTLLCPGTLDSRKGQDRIYSAFCQRSPVAERLRLVFVGRVPEWTSPSLAELLNTRRADVELVTNASDGRVAEELRRARALVYTSPAEGYGLPRWSACTRVSP